MITLCNAAGHKLFMNECDSDVSIKVEWENSRWHFPAHKLVLSAMSEVFRIMFHIDMQEKINREVVIVDSNPVAVKQFLRYLYMGITDFAGWMEALNVLKVAHMYGVQTLIHQCENHLESGVTISNACILHDVAVTYNLKNLRYTTQTLIMDVGFIVSCTEGFFNLKASSLEYFLASRNFNMEHETVVLDCLKEWATNECSRKSLELTRDNILAAMEPFLQYIRWNSISPRWQTFVPKSLVQKHGNFSLTKRRALHVSPVHQYHVNVLKFIVELGAFTDNHLSDSGFKCLKFGVDNHIFMCGFKIVSMFRMNCAVDIGTSTIILKRADHKYSIQYNLNSVPWTKGLTAGGYVWREMYAYFPCPIRIEPFYEYTLSVKCGTLSSSMSIKWPSTRLEDSLMCTELGPINFSAYGPCYGLTQLFVFPAPPKNYPDK